MRRSAIAAVIAGTLTVAGLTTAEAGQDSRSRFAKGQSRNSSILLDIDYRDGSLNSGIPDLTTTHATAEDASYVVESGADHAIAHKVTLGDPGYVSDGAPRSESATNNVPEGRIHVGDEHRYEFSVLLKDWETYEPGDSETGDIIFQGKHAGGNLPSFYIMTKRSSIAFRSPTLNLQSTVVDDFRPYLGEWMRFRVDVKWTDDSTGYYRVSARMPGESEYTLRQTYENVQTFHPVNPTDFGYLKWGLYRPSETLEKGDVPTRIIFHDDIRILDLSAGDES
ncbi:polysaccharide lyase (plasmid) [Streptomyces sp. NBC_00841]|uniref:heparin lyase I family protein n=1 Tax=unclassified Streptomyces TaxID=2593676 RepID=UPI0022528D30|nr:MULTISPECIES: heparin lyase I family protein [unclassified Streptomyces]MCX4538847.1 polysaccharide lyase [Streptomyces sp. NBC_01669]WSA05359.1 polysaccharide lyase [Streptomyces sp. NBC_00841]